MPKIKTDNGNVVKVSLFDVLKSDKTLELEAALRRAKAAKKTGQGNDTAETATSAKRAAIEKTAIEKYLEEKAAAKEKAKEKETREKVAAAEREAIEKAAIEKYLAEKEAEEKAAKEKEEAEKAAAAAVIERYLAEKAAEIAAAEQAEAIRAAAEKVAVEKILSERTGSDVHTGASTASAASSAKAPVSYVWTPEQDKRLRELKLADNTWRAISSELEGRPINELKRRWAKIRKSADSSDEENRKSKGSEKTKWKGKGKQKVNSKGKSRRVDSESSDDSASDGEEKSSRSEWSEGTKQKHRVSFADPLPTSEKNDTGSVPVKEVRKYFYMDDKFTLEEIILLHKLADHYENEKWLRVSSRFFDKTGRRISPDDAKLRVKRDMRED